MMKSLVIFGSGEIAHVAQHYFREESGYDVAAFTVDSEYIQEPHFCGLPVVPFDDVSRHYPPSDHHFFVALSYAGLNSIRRQKFLAARELGYELASFISPHATVLNGGRIGKNCFILEDNTIQPYAEIGNNVTLWSGNHIGHHSVIRDHTFIASHVVISGGVEIGEQCFLGVNATLRDHIKIGDRCIIGAGALMLADAEPDGVYIGNGSRRSRVPSGKVRRL
jgi:sugar O-acyltransferase (sialic acid O-acetyltransferase NeuD family)